MGLWALLLLVLLQCLAPVVQAAGTVADKTRYEWLLDNDKGYYYFDKVTFGLVQDPYLTEKHFDVWIRMQFLDEGIYEEENYRRLNKMPADDYQYLSHRMFHYWFRTRDRHYQLLEIADYDETGRMLENRKIKYSPERWVTIVPGTDQDAWLLKLSAYKLWLDEEKKKQ